MKLNINNLPFKKGNQCIYYSYVEERVYLADITDVSIRPIPKHSGHYWVGYALCIVRNNVIINKDIGGLFVDTDSDTYFYDMFSYLKDATCIIHPLNKRIKELHSQYKKDKLELDTHREVLDIQHTSDLQSIILNGKLAL